MHGHEQALSANRQAGSEHQEATANSSSGSTLWIVVGASAIVCCVCLYAVWRRVAAMPEVRIGRVNIGRVSLRHSTPKDGEAEGDGDVERGDMA
jgi:hypothetical protein